MTISKTEMNCIERGGNKQTDVVDEFAECSVRLALNVSDMASQIAYAAAANKLRDELIATRAELEKYQWISVNERMPDRRGYYITYCPNIGLPEYSEYRPSTGRFLLDTCGYRITHWIPRPLLPTPQGD